LKVEGSILIGRHCKIGEGVKIANSSIDNYTQRARNGVEIENSAVMDRVIIGDKASIKESIIGRHVTVLSNESKPTRMNSVSVVADDVVITEGSVISGTKVYPHQRVRGTLTNQMLMPN
jgi:NDP-sugar pyrophosphorylase family protein